ncbi:MAG: exodeoxyribonuclease VII large subunit [Gammaproteobacteria bacterium SHHR-1]|uniref:exodeoxyribonuclease VII large subunit n=1 Tax=Magnetovirga frankeli TaxID=947516 RepID=UPI001292E6DB|nr:exodeoxyribonuclease VII large subunit [gamma proteobacterium SS-5]
MNPNTRDIYSVSRLTNEVRLALEQGFPLLWVQGEIGNLAAPRSGHLYFTLKDAQAQVRCALFRHKAQLLRFRPKEGDQVLLRGRLSLYEARGDFQLIAESLEPAGEGALRQALEALKHRLASEGLFDPARKRPLPAYPRRIGVLSSPSGAAVHDVLSVLKRRYPAVEVIIYPIPVQGEEAPEQIVQMLRRADARGECDLFILTRGGGSLEDLMAFNDEQLAHCLSQLRTPLIAAIGHEIDTSLADLAADQRAPTPSAAAELASPSGEQLLMQLAQTQRRLGLLIGQQLQRQGQRLERADQRLRHIHPARRLQQQEQRLDELGLRLQRSQRQRLQRARERLDQLQARLQARHPSQQLQRLRARLQPLSPRLLRASQRLLADRQQLLRALARQLQAVSPLATLERGYAIVHKLPERSIVRRSEQIRSGDRLSVRLAQGEVELIKP